MSDPSRAIRAIAFTFLAALAAARSGAAQATGDNLLIVIADDLGVDQVACYGEGTRTAPTPTIDALAASGVLFRNAWAHPLCSPTRAALHTGRRPFRTGIGTALAGANDPVLALAETTLPELVGAAGHATALIGKWHLGTNGIGGALAPNAAGWSHFAGALAGAVPSYYQWVRVVDGTARMHTSYATSTSVDDALAWIGARSGPWLCVVAFHAPHTPYEAPPASLHSEDLTGLDPNTTPRPFYRAMVEAMDRELARLLAGLGAARARTNVIFLGDNGTPGTIAMAPFTRSHGKGTPYEGGVNVPLIVAGPIVAAPGRESAALVEASDVFTTAAALCGVDARAALPAGTALDGVSFVDVLANPSAAGSRRSVFAERFDDGDEDACLRDARHKLIRRRSGSTESFELYDLVADPFEADELLAGSLDAEQQRAWEELRAVLAAARDEGLALRFGAGCGGLALDAAAGAPTLGAGFTVAIESIDPAASAAALLLGLSRDLAGSVALPLPLDAFGMPGCALLVSIEDAIPLPIGAGRAAFGFAVPAEPSLLDARFHSQGLVLQLAANPAGVLLSNALTTVVGA